ncbi:MAG TPA: RNA polymerase subunit sigma, partial [Planctomycetaceae bacterium]|nr:RNA polymerase subunit sigma [Planctomycetaceae bacterium]
STRVRRAEAVRAVQVGWASLPEVYRRVLWLRCFPGLSVEETAAAMGRSTGSIRGLCSRAKQRLRDILGRASSHFSG